MDRGHLVKVALGVLVSALSLGGVGGCGGRYEIDKSKSAAANSRGGLQLLEMPRPEKIDFLFMIDNSASMGEKQRLLSEALGGLVKSIAAPRCITADGRLVPRADPNTPCEEGTPEFEGVEDIHLGVITSSLGDHGSGDICSSLGSTSVTGPTFDDRAQLLATVRSDLASSDPAGFLAWAPGGSAVALDHVIENFADHVTAAGEGGCNFEASLEAWYRFLVDPEPVQSMTNNGMVSVPGPVNQVVLEQRAAFLRPDSLLVIVMLTDENDCSIVDEPGTQGWLIPFKGGPNENHWRMPRGHAVCGTKPNDPSCSPCGQGDTDPGCMYGLPYAPEEDHPALRCFHQKERFGIDLLYPTQRYTDALTERQIDPRYTGRLVDNPIFDDWQVPPAVSPTLGPLPSGPPRPQDWVILAGIVGVPWQDLATTESLDSESGLTFLSAAELKAEGRWELMLGPDGTGRAPTDPFMLESVDPRPSEAHPLLPDAWPEQPTLDVQPWNYVNGHEQFAVARDRLQLACTFPLGTSIACTEENREHCECYLEDFERNSPLCAFADPQAGVQLLTGAYPSTRQLNVLKSLGDNAVTTSICPKYAFVADPEIDPNYGYNPAMSAITESIKQRLVPECLDEPLPVDDAGRATCTIYEALGTENCGCNEADGRLPASSDASSRVISWLTHNGHCGGAGQGPVPCADYCVCEIQQFDGPELETCLAPTADPGGQFGYCYIDPEAGSGAASLVAGCPANQKRKIRFLGSGTIPAKNSTTLIDCSSG